MDISKEKLTQKIFIEKDSNMFLFFFLQIAKIGSRYEKVLKQFFLEKVIDLFSICIR